MTIREAVDAFGKAAYALGVASARGGPTYPLRQQEHDEALARLHEVLQRDCPHTVTREGNSQEDNGCLVVDDVHRVPDWKKD